jgi:2',3'-cyclic-nucleotide 2'-phosphodiesterase/3'-nucleotidase
MCSKDKKEEETMSNKSIRLIILTIALTLVMAAPVLAWNPATATEAYESRAQEDVAALAPSQAVSVTILHTNDFHGHLEPDYRGRGGSAYIATAIDKVRKEYGEDNVMLVDAGDVTLGAPPISQLVEGESAIDIYNMLGYDVAAFGNHEFDLGKEVLISRTQESDFPWIGANIVVSGTNYEHPDWVKPYVTMTVGSPNTVTVGIIGVDTDETPVITVKGSTEGLEFKDLTEAILHYYDDVMAQSDALVVLAHMGTEDSRDFKGLKTVAQELIDAGKPVDLMIGGHQHEPLYEPVMVSDTAIIEAGYYGHWVGHADVVIDADTKSLSIDSYDLITVTTDTFTPTAVISERVAYWAEQIVTQTQEPVGSTYISLTRDYNDESVMGDLVADGMLWKADQVDDGEVNDSIDIAFTNPGGLRDNIEVSGMLPYTITWGETFNVMPFGNTLFLMDLTGAQIKTLLDQAASLYKGILQSSGVTWDWYNDDADAYEPDPTVWGATNVRVGGEPLSSTKVYRVVTNNFLAGGQDGWVTFADGTNRYDTGYSIQEGVNDYIATISPIESSDIVMGRITQLSTLAVTKTVSPTTWVELGDVVTYTISINTDITATNVTITDPLPANVTFGRYVGDKGSAELPVSDVITWTSPLIGAGDGYTFVFTATVTETESTALPPQVRNVAYFSSDDAGSGCDDAIFKSPRYIYLPLVVRNFGG